MKKWNVKNRRRELNKAMAKQSLIKHGPIHRSEVDHKIHKHIDHDRCNHK